MAVVRHYEQLLLSRETAILENGLVTSSVLVETVLRIAQLVRQALRLEHGEDADDKRTERRDVEVRGRGYTEKGPEIDWALERESELIRLEKENEDLRRLVELGDGTSRGEDAVGRQIAAVRHPYAPRRMRRGTLMGGGGPYGRFGQPSWGESDGWQGGSPRRQMYQV